MQKALIGSAVAVLLFLGMPGSPGDYGVAAAQAQSADTESLLVGLETGHCEADNTFAIVVHGGAAFWRGGIHATKLPLMRQLLTDARSLLASGGRAIDIVEAVIASMENSGLYNAGKGAIANQAGAIELDASIMEC